MENQEAPANPNKGNLGDGAIHQPQLPIKVHNQVCVDHQFENALRMQSQAPRHYDYYRGNMNIVDSSGPLVPTPTASWTHIRDDD